MNKHFINTNEFHEDELIMITQILDEEKEINFKKGK
jgi:hypothetical protein